MVKQMQEQVISMQDKQISFLNNNISTTLTTISVVVGIIGLISVGLGTWIGFAHRSAKKKMNEAEVKMNEAKEKINYAESIINKADEAMERLETYREEVRGHKVETEEKFQELNSSIDNRLEKTKQIEDKIDSLWLRHQAKEKIARLGQMLEYIETNLQFLTDNDGTGKEIPDYTEFQKQNDDLAGEYRLLQPRLDLTLPEDIPMFDDYCSRILQKSFNLLGEIQDISFKFHNSQKNS